MRLLRLTVKISMNGVDECVDAALMKLDGSVSVESFKEVQSWKGESECWGKLKLERLKAVEAGRLGPGSCSELTAMGQVLVAYC